MNTSSQTYLNILLSTRIFSGGDFGDLERVEFEGRGKVGTIDFWSQGWIGVDVFDCNSDEQILNKMLSPDERESTVKTFEILMELLSR